MNNFENFQIKQESHYPQTSKTQSRSMDESTCPALRLIDELLSKVANLGNNIFTRCQFDCDTLMVCNWNRNHEIDLASSLLSILTPEVTHSLPPDWTGKYDLNRCESFIENRNKESSTLLIIEKESNEAIGLMIIYINIIDNQLNLGYLLKKKSWGKGYATKVVNAFISYCKENLKDSDIQSIIAGCAVDNIGSQKVLTKNGFTVIKEQSNDHELMFRLTL